MRILLHPERHDRAIPLGNDDDENDGGGGGGGDGGFGEEVAIQRGSERANTEGAAVRQGAGAAQPEARDVLRRERLAGWFRSWKRRAGSAGGDEPGGDGIGRGDSIRRGWDGEDAQGVGRRRSENENRLVGIVPVRRPEGVLRNRGPSCVYEVQSLFGFIAVMPDRYLCFVGSSMI